MSAKDYLEGKKKLGKVIVIRPIKTIPLTYLGGMLSNIMEENNPQIRIYQTENGETKLDVRFQEETVWLTQRLMAELFQTTPQNITIHLRNIFEEGELEEKATCKDFLQAQLESGR